MLLLIIALLTITFVLDTNVFGYSIKLDDANGYFKFTELKEGVGGLIEGTDRIACTSSGFFDKNGNYISKEDWTAIAGFYNGIARVRDKNGHAIFIDTEGNVVLETNYDYEYTGNYREGLISVLLEKHNKKGFGGKCGYIDINGNVIIKVPEMFDSAKDFVKGYAAVGKIYDGDLPVESGVIYLRGISFDGYINKKGEFVGKPDDVYIYDHYLYYDKSVQNTQEHGMGEWYKRS